MMTTLWKRFATWFRSHVTDNWRKLWKSTTVLLGGLGGLLLNPDFLQLVASNVGSLPYIDAETALRVASYLMVAIAVLRFYRQPGVANTPTEQAILDAKKEASTP